MKEIVFVEKNSHRWKEYESILKSNTATTPDRMSELFIQITDDLAYARTHYPSSKLNHYLNSLALLSHNKIYRNKKIKKRSVLQFWKIDYPLLLHANRRYIYYSLVVFVVAIAVGWLSSVHDDGFVRLILGDSYVNMTLENIGQNDPMAVYKQMNQGEMFLRITINNVYVAFRTVVMGLVVIVGAALSLVQNGIMVGAFQFLFYKHGLLRESFETIFLHGTLELFAIVMAGASGFIFGAGILFPGTYSRYESFKRNVAVGAKMLIGIVPIFVVAAFIEGYITRLTAWPEWAKLFIILGSAVFIIIYFFIYPILISKTSNHGRI